MEVRVQFRDAGDMKRFGELDLNADISRTYAWAYVTPAELERVRKEGFEFSITKPDLNAWSASFGDALVPPGYYTFTEIKNIADSLATRFPSICRKVVYGFNQQMQELAALKISDNVMLDEAEPEILFDGGIHGDEVGASQNVIQFARDLCLGYGTDLQMTGLIDSREIWLYYCVNPWGRDMMTRYNSASVDINRDNGYMWGGEGGSPGPFSQPETKALRKCQYENQFVSYTNYHSGTEIISYPWSYRLSPCPDQESIDLLAQAYADASGYPSLPYGQGSIMMYLIQGSTKDFNYGALGSAAWSMEISMEKQPTNPQYYYNINKPAMLALIEHSGYGIQGMITDAITGKPVEAAIFVGNNYPVYSDGEVGDYHKYLMPGIYSIRVQANGYESKTISNIPVNLLECTTVDFQMQPRANQYCYRVISSRIPNFNAQNPGDEGYTAACIGPPDQVSYSLGRGGYVIIDMLDTIYDGAPGTFDLTVYEGDSSPEGYTLYAGPGMDGPWTNIGFGTGTMSFDMNPYGVTEARYFMLLDDNNGQSNVSDAGFDLDAIACLHPAIPDTIGHISGHVIDVFTMLPVEGVSVLSGDSLVLTDSAGYYSIGLTRGEQELCAVMDGYRQECDTLLLVAGTSYTNDFYLFPNTGRIENEATESMTVLPNPFVTQFTLQLNLKRDVEGVLELFDLMGNRRMILAKGIFSAGKQEFGFDNGNPVFSKLDSGCYLLRLTMPHGQIRTKVIKAF